MATAASTTKKIWNSMVSDGCCCVFVLCLPAVFIGFEIGGWIHYSAQGRAIDFYERLKLPDEYHCSVASVYPTQCWEADAEYASEYNDYLFFVQNVSALPNASPADNCLHRTIAFDQQEIAGSCENIHEVALPTPYSFTVGESLPCYTNQECSTVFHLSTTQIEEQERQHVRKRRVGLIIGCVGIVCCLFSCAWCCIWPEIRDRRKAHATDAPSIEHKTNANEQCFEWYMSEAGKQQEELKSKGWETGGAQQEEPKSKGCKTGGTQQEEPKGTTTTEGEATGTQQDELECVEGEATGAQHWNTRTWMFENLFFASTYIEKYCAIFMENGYDNVDAVASITRADLIRMKIVSDSHQTQIMKAIAKLS